MTQKEIKIQNKLVEKFNSTFKIGSFVKFKKTKFSEEKEVTVKSEAFMNHGNAVVFFNEISGFCSIEPIFVSYSQADA